MSLVRDPVLENPWITTWRPPEQPERKPGPIEVTADSPTPQPGVQPPPPEQRLPSRQLARKELLVPVWLTSAHGGAGSSTLADLSGLGWRAAGTAWPISPDPNRPARVLLCARTSYTGLRAAQVALTDWASGRVPVELEGVVLLAAAPGRLPKPLRPLLELVRGAAGRVWEVGWQSPWLVGPAVMTGDRGLRELFERFNIQPREV